MLKIKIYSEQKPPDEISLKHIFVEYVTTSKLTKTTKMPNETMLFVEYFFANCAQPCLKK